MTQTNDEMYKYEESVIPLKWTAWDAWGQLEHIYYNCMFTKDFGPFIAGKHYDSIFINYGSGEIESYKNGGKDVEHTVKFIASVV